MISRKDLEFNAENKNKNEAKLKSQGQSARSQRWFYLEFDCIEVNFSTREPNFYKKSFRPMTTHMKSFRTSLFRT